MAKFSDITVDVKADISWSKKTADLALRIVEMYINANKMVVIVDRKENGELELHYELAG